MKPSIELIRLLAVILITFTHTRHHFDAGFMHTIIVKLPTYGTAILSIISGYLYYTVSQKKENLLNKKIKTLAVPYLIANVSVLILVLIANYFFGYDALNRLSYDPSIILNGVFALNAPPINPPTYFIRDIFIIFTIIALITNKNYRAIFILLPFVFFGTLILRHDIASLFILGICFAYFKEKTSIKMWLVASIIVLIIVAIWLPSFLKFPVAFLIFIAMVDVEFKFYNTGRFSYLLHLYHSPIMVTTYPILALFLNNPIVLVFAQISLAIFFVSMLFLLTKKHKRLLILSGGR